jgi:hypothetical protein
VLELGKMAAFVDLEAPPKERRQKPLRVETPAR